MKTSILAVATAAVFALAGAPVLAAPLDLAQAQGKLRDAGYTIHEVEKSDGLWEADVTRKDGRFVEVYIDPKTGEIFDEFDGRPVLDAGQVVTKAQQHGFKDIHSVERDGATWKLDARNDRNQKVEVRLGGYDGRVLSVEKDGWFD